MALLVILSLSCVNAADINETNDESQTNQGDVVTSDSNSSAFLVLDNDADKENIEVGDEVTWEVSVINLGNDTAKNVRVMDQLPEGLAYISHTLTKGTFNPVTGIWYIGDLAVSEGEVFLYILTKALTVGEKINKAQLLTDSINLNENESYEEEEIDVIGHDSDSISKTNIKYQAGYPVALILLALIAIFTTSFLRPKK